MRVVTLGVGAMASPRYAPAGLLVSHARQHVMIDGGPGAVPRGRLDAWLVTDERSELIAQIRRVAHDRHLEPRARDWRGTDWSIRRMPVEHTSHDTYGYLIVAGSLRVGWAPEFFAFPSWARGLDLLFAEGASWRRPIFFAGGVGGHLDVLSVARAARGAGVRRLVFAHLGRPTLRALDAGELPPFGEFARDGQVFLPRARRR